MKVVILAGGMGSRLSEETQVRPKPMAATLTAVRPLGRFGATPLEGSRVKSFMEKPAGDGGRINGGFFVLQQACSIVLRTTRQRGKLSPN